MTTNLTAVEKKPLAYRFARLTWLKWLILILPFFYVMLMLIIPAFGMLSRAVIGPDGFTMQYLIKAFTGETSRKVMWLTLRTGLFVTLFAMLLAYPLSYLACRTPYRLVREVIDIAVMLPFCVSMLARVFAWRILLQDQGIINQALVHLGVISEPIKLLYSTTAVIIAMTSMLFPYMYLSIHSVMLEIDQNYLRAAQGMGARPFRSFWDVFFPLSIPGILAGSLMVFILSLGYYIVPALVGGASDLMISNLIQDAISTTLDWNTGAALSILLIVTTLVILAAVAALLALLRYRKKPKEAA